MPVNYVALVLVCHGKQRHAKRALRRFDPFEWKDFTVKVKTIWFENSI